MAKQHSLVSPYGDITLEPLPDHFWIRTDSLLAGDWALGWLHAREAGDEALFIRSFWTGTLGSEGKPSAARTEVDDFLGRWAFTQDLNLETSRLRPGDRARIQAYAQGFNQGRHRRSKEKPWTPEDCHLAVRALGFLEWWETRAPQMALLLKMWQEGLSWARILDLWPGLGPEPDKAGWSGISIPAPFSPEARLLVNRIRRFRPGTSLPYPGSNTGGHPCLAGSYVTDVTEPGLPFIPIRVDTLEKSVRGLSRPGHPGFLAGRTDVLAWHGTPVADDTVDLRTIDGTTGRGVAGFWAGAGRTGTLQSLLLLEEAPTAGWARDHCADLGSATLDFTAVDSRGTAVQWAQGPRWLRPSLRDAWLPAPWGSEVPAGSRSRLGSHEDPIPGRWTADSLGELLSRSQSELPDQILPPLRFLLPDTEEGVRLRKWAGTPGEGPAADDFNRLFGALVDCFWEGSPLVPHADSPAFQALLPAMVRLLQVPHSAWFPSSEKNRRLAEAVRKAFGPGAPDGPSVLGRRAPKPCWTEVHGDKPRIFASTVIITSDLGTRDWKVFLTDDETEPVRFAVW